MGTYLLSNPLVHTKMWKNSSMNDSQQKGKIFTSVIFTNCPKDETSNGAYFEWSTFHQSSEFNVFFFHSHWAQTIHLLYLTHETTISPPPVEKQTRSRYQPPHRRPSYRPDELLHERTFAIIFVSSVRNRTALSVPRPQPSKRCSRVVTLWRRASVNEPLSLSQVDVLLGSQRTYVTLRRPHAGMRAARELRGASTDRHIQVVTFDATWTPRSQQSSEGGEEKSVELPVWFTTTARYEGAIEFFHQTNQNQQQQRQATKQL